jgi:hypothetical protein
MTYQHSTVDRFNNSQGIEGKGNNVQEVQGAKYEILQKISENSTYFILGVAIIIFSLTWHLWIGKIIIKGLIPTENNMLKIAIISNVMYLFVVAAIYYCFVKKFETDGQVPAIIAITIFFLAASVINYSGSMPKTVANNIMQEKIPTKTYKPGDKAILSYSAKGEMTPYWFNFAKESSIRFLSTNGNYEIIQMNGKSIKIWQGEKIPNKMLGYYRIKAMGPVKVLFKIKKYNPKYAVK